MHLSNTNHYTSVSVSVTNMIFLGCLCDSHLPLHSAADIPSEGCYLTRCSGRNQVLLVTQMGTVSSLPGRPTMPMFNRF